MNKMIDKPNSNIIGIIVLPKFIRKFAIIYYLQCLQTIVEVNVYMSKVPFGEAASVAGVHFNTLRNWRKAGKLKTAEKVIENGRELWLVEQQEVDNISRQSRQNAPETPANYHVDIDGVNPANDPPIEPRNGPGLSTTPALEQTLVFMRESVVRPLVEANERQAARLEEMAEEVGSLKERVRELEARLAQNKETIRSVAQPVIEPSPVLNRETLQPELPKKRRWWQF